LRGIGVDNAQTRHRLFGSLLNTFNPDAVIDDLFVDDGVIRDVLGHVHQSPVLSMRHDMMVDA
jgi:hypothetical protein